MTGEESCTTYIKEQMIWEAVYTNLSIRDLPVVGLETAQRLANTLYNQILANRMRTKDFLRIETEEDKFTKWVERMYKSIEHRFVIYTAMLCCLPPVVFSLRWFIKSKYMVFGGDVLLNCDGTACLSNSIKKWIGGPHQDLLCFNTTCSSSYTSKYEMMVEDKSPNFGLKIKNFTNDDINCRYTCACGLHHYTHMLDLDAGKYIYPPRVITNSNLQTTEEYVVDVVIEVYPTPRCFIEYEDRVTQVNLISNLSRLSTLDERMSGRNNVYKERIKHTLQTNNSNNCDGILLVTCDVDSGNYIVYKQNVSTCKDPIDINKTTIKGNGVAVVVIFIVLLILIGMALVWYTIKHCKPCEMSCLRIKSILKCKWMKQADNNNEPPPDIDILLMMP